MIFNKVSGWLIKGAEYCLYLFLFTFPFINYTSFLYFGSVTRSINLILVSSIFAVGIGVSLFNRKSEMGILRSKVFWVLFIYLFSIFVSAIFGASFKESFFSNITRTTGLWFLISLGIFGLILIRLFESSTIRRRLIYTISIPSAIFSFLSLLSNDGFGVLFASWKIDGFTFGNSTFAGMYLLAGFFLSLSLLFTHKNGRLKFLLPIIIICNPYFFNFNSSEGSGIFNFLGEARASGLALIGALAVLMLSLAVSKIKREDVQKRITYLVAGFAAASMLWGGFSLLSPDGMLRKAYLSQATEARPLIWEISSELISQKPVLGWGTENFEKTFLLNYDNRILEEKFGNESWFDRAHNVFIDQAFENGFLGLILYISVYIVSGLVLLRILFSNTNRENKALSLFLLVYIFFHFIELQTAFDTSISFVILAVIFALIISLEREVFSQAAIEKRVSEYVKYIVAVMLIIWGCWSLFGKLIPFIRSEAANGSIRKIGSAEKRLAMYDDLFNSPVDPSGILWRTVNDFQRSVNRNKKVLESPDKVATLKQEVSVFETNYKNYLENNPDDFRALLNYAHIKIYFMLFGVDKLDEAHVVLDRAIELVPQAPQPYWMKSVAFLYKKDFAKAREYAKKAYDLNPKINESVKVQSYIESSIKTFPEINPYFFSKI